MPTPDIFLVEDDQRLAELTKTYFEQNGLSVHIENRGDKALERFDQVQAKLVILDLMLPGENGITVCKRLLEKYSVPVLILTAKSNDIDQVIGLESGADDYVIKPAEPMVLLARVRALLRRADGVQPKSTAKEIRIGKLFLNSSSQTVMIDENELEFTTQEFALLWQLALNVGTILSRDDLFKLVRGIDYDGLDRSIDVRISRIRKKLGDDPRMPYIIKTVWGRGYLLSPDAWND